jgi:exopolysaccharide production protein ExoY
MNSKVSLTVESHEFLGVAPETIIETPDSDRGPVGGSVKRLLDLAIALTALILLAPILVMVAVLLKTTTGGNVLFGHQRLGYRGRPFKCLKFQTMVSNGDQVLAAHLRQNPAARLEWETNRKLRDDPRVTPIGRILRSSSLDELPQLFNVLQGSMSIVGPRPIVKAEVERYGTYFNSYLACRPGITGLWQVSGRSDCGYEQRVRLDDSYAKTWSMLRDVLIICKTAVVVISREGSC